MSIQFSDTIKELIAKARIVSFAGWNLSHPTAAIQLFQAADDERRYLFQHAAQQHIYDEAGNDDDGIEAVERRAKVAS